MSNRESEILDEFKAKFKEIKRLGYHKTHREHNTGIGKTFEDLLGIEENNSTEPDFKGYEIKTSRRLSRNTKTSLFTKSPTYPRGVNRRIHEQFAIINPSDGNRGLHVTMKVGEAVPYREQYYFRLIDDPQSEKIILKVEDKDGNELPIEGVDEIYWSYEDLNRCLSNKLKNLIYVTADSKNSGAQEEFHYKSAVVYSKVSFTLFLEMLRAKRVVIELRLGQRKGRRFHDHGTGFRATQEDIDHMYEHIEIIE